VAAKMRETPVEDFFGRHGRLREDGLMVHDLPLMQVKKPEDSKYPWDYYQLLTTISGRPGVPAARPRLLAGEEITPSSLRGRAAPAAPNDGYRKEVCRTARGGTKKARLSETKRASQGTTISI
jgi:hypothetical protein